MDDAKQDPSEWALPCVESVTLTQFRRYCVSPAAALAEASLAELPFLQHLAGIVLLGAGLEITFKMHFMTVDALTITRRKLGSETVTLTQSIDCMKEFLNLLAGKVKELLEREGVELGQSLPFAIQGYNEIFFREAKSGLVKRAWRLVDQTSSVICSAAVLVKSPALEPVLKRVANTESEETRGGAIEMF